MAKILITGSTGYVGSRLIHALGNTDHLLWCTARNPEYLQQKLPTNARVVKADFSNTSDLEKAFQDVDIAYFLIHALGEKSGFESTESKIAQNFALGAQKAGVKKIVYLGGLVHETDSELSPHMRSRKYVGDILRASGIPVIEFRASVILGPGSLSFELIRALVERLPIMVTPKWVRVNAQPIYIDDVVEYLTQAITANIPGSKTFEIGGLDIVSYQQIMETYAEARGLTRFMIPVPFLTPYLSSLWLGLVTPIYARIGRKLIDSITDESVVKNPQAGQYFNIKPLHCAEAINRALAKEDAEIIESKWSDALSSSIKNLDETNIYYRNRIVDVHRIEVPDDCKTPFAAVEAIGGRNGWYYLNFLWAIRGFMDLMVGGIGMRRGRRNHSELATGDTIDWWRVEKFRKGEHLRLRAEMKVPGRAWLDFEIVTEKNKRYLQQTVIFDPLGLFGIIYWYILLPVHWILFKGMLKRIIEKSCN